MLCGWEDERDRGNGKIRNSRNAGTAENQQKCHGIVSAVVKQLVWLWGRWDWLFERCIRFDFG